MSLALAVIGAALAALFALVDSALLRATLEVGGEAPAPRREAEHRALAFARVLAQLGTGAAVAAALGLDARPAWQAALVVVALGLLAVAVTETAARELGDALGARGVEALLPIARAAVLLLAPVVALAVRLDEALLRALPPPAPDEVSREETAEQFREIVAAEAEVSREERALLAGVFAMGDTQVSEVMVPRVDVVGVERTTPWSEVVDRVRASEHSRIPVYDETIDDVVGVLYAKDVLTAVVADAEPAPDWTALVRPTSFIPTTKHLDAQLRDFRASGNHMAIVVDEFGGTAGIVTIEDVLEEIVGEIRDERDDEEAPIERDGDRRFWVSARVTLDELSETLGHEFPEAEDVSTSGGSSTTCSAACRAPASGWTWDRSGWSSSASCGARSSGCTSSGRSRPSRRPPPSREPATAPPRAARRGRRRSRRRHTPADAARRRPRERTRRRGRARRRPAAAAMIDALQAALLVALPAVLVVALLTAGAIAVRS
jgi:CBS domain containing-hemolysin-like protein